MKDHYNFENSRKNPYIIQFVVTQNGYEVTTVSGKPVGLLITDHEGKWLFRPDSSEGLSHQALSILASKLQELNSRAANQET